jgi:putative endonuclease
MTSSRVLGREIEQLAELYLRKRGLSTVAHNYACRSGEIDLVMLHGSTVVFVEVRYRRSNEFGGAVESITQKKKQRLIRTAEHFLMQNDAFAESTCRFDVVAVHGTEPGYSISWIEDAFSA